MITIARSIIFMAWGCFAFWMLQSRGVFWPRIDQGIEVETDGLLGVHTYVWSGGKLVWSHHTFQDIYPKMGIEEPKLDSAKRKNHQMATEWVEKYKKCI